MNEYVIVSKDDTLKNLTYIVVGMCIGAFIFYERCKKRLDDLENWVDQLDREVSKSTNKNVKAGFRT